MLQGAVGLAIFAQMQPLLILGGILLLIQPTRDFRRTFDEARWHMAIEDFDAPIVARSHVAHEDDGAWSSITAELDLESAVTSLDTRLSKRRERWTVSQNTTLIADRLAKPRISL